MNSFSFAAVSDIYGIEVKKVRSQSSRWCKRELEDDGGAEVLCGAESVVQPYREIVASGLPRGDGGGAAMRRCARVGK